MRNSFLTTLVFAFALLLGAGCDSHTCANACAQYYGTGDGQCGRSSALTDGTTPEVAERECTKDCRDAQYRTAASTGNASDAGGYSRLENEQDAFAFIDCVVDKDYSDAVFNQTCEDLFFDCPWIKW